jgi:membrane peptidoglycan carboxypeptidase
VIKSGTGKQAALPDGRPAAGKTGTTENYGDAWFIGYTPQLAVAVWVGYPNKLRPMETEFHGGPVAGGTFPALIWKAFMEQALPYLHDDPQDFPTPQFPYASPKNVVLRNGRLELDNGVCRNTTQVMYFTSEGPSRVANCKPNEVEVPSVVGEPVRTARARLAAQPLEASFVYRPAQPRQRLGVVLNQYPSSGYLSSYDKVTLVLAKPLHGVVPRVVGLTVEQAKARLKARRLHARVQPDGARSSARVVSQWPRAGVAAAHGMHVRLVTRG